MQDQSPHFVPHPCLHPADARVTGVGCAGLSGVDGELAEKHRMLSLWRIADVGGR